MKRLVLLTVALARLGFAEPAADSFKSNIQPLLESYCTDCHGGEKPKAKVNLAGPHLAEQLAAGSDLWYRVLEQLESGKMPPKKEEQPKPDERRAMVEWVRGDFTHLMLAKQRAEGRSKLRRLTRSEYANTVQDIFGVRPLVESHLPSDGLVDGYDKVSNALALSMDGAKGYLKMAEDELSWFLKSLPPVASNQLAARTVRGPAVESGESPGHSLVLPGGTIVSFNSDNSSGRINHPGIRVPGRYHVRMSVYAYQTDKPLPFGLYIGRTYAYPQEIDLAEIFEAPPGKATVLEADVDFKEGQNMRLIPFGLGVPVPKNSQASKCGAPGLAVQWLETVAPELPIPGDRFLTADLPRAMEQEMRYNPSAHFSRTKSGAGQSTSTPAEFRDAMEKTFQRVGARLYRRDLTKQELAGYTNEAMRQAEAEETPLATAFFSQIVEMMTAPDFLCVIERPGPLTDFALAARISYFLWNSTPDEKLLEIAREGRLHEPKVLAEQTERLLKETKSARFIGDFTDQWLGLRAIADTSPDGKLYPDYDELVRFSSVRETRAYVAALIAENLGIRRLVDAPWAMLNQPLASLYRVPGVTGLQMRKVDLPGGSPYGGLWTQSAILKVTANGTDTSPVKRGVWVSERLLGIHIPPPPPNINPVQPDIRGAKTLRQQLAMHSSDASCAACHARFDPYGFALESFDVAGGFRTSFRELDPDVAPLRPDQRKGRATWRNGLPVDCKGRTPDGQSFADIAELRKLLARQSRQLAIGLTRHLITYATGTPPTGADQPAIEAIVQRAADGDYPVRSLIHALVQSELFRNK